MKFPGKTVLFSVLFLVAVFSAFSQVKEVPEFTLKRMDNGAPFSRSNMTPGKKSLFIFFDPGCGHCQDAMKEYNASNKKLDNVAIYLVSRDSKQVANSFLASYAPAISKRKNMVLLQDVNNVFIGKFYPKKFPSMFLFDKNKKLIIYSDENKDVARIIELINQK